MPLRHSSESHDKFSEYKNRCETRPLFKRPQTNHSKRGFSPFASSLDIQKRFPDATKNHPKSASSTSIHTSKREVIKAKLTPGTSVLSTISPSTQPNQGKAVTSGKAHGRDWAPGLPREVLDLIIRHLDTNDIKVLSLTSRAMSLTLGYIPYNNYSSWKSHLCHIYHHKKDFFANMCSRCEQEWRDSVLERAFIRYIASSPIEEGSLWDSSAFCPEKKLPSWRKHVSQF